MNCHSVGLHSFPISFENGMYKRVFYADTNHNMWRPFELAVHPHHVDIKLTVLEGRLYNLIFEVCESVVNSYLLNKFRWNSHILEGKGGFGYLGEESLRMTSCDAYEPGQSVIMKACELHTVEVEFNKRCVWLIEESEPSCDYFPINYSPEDLTQWSPEGLYEEVGDDVKNKYLGLYMDQINKLCK